MSNQRFDDELLSAIIDGEADTELVASVNESPEASARLDHMRQAVEAVAEPAAEATPERRSASIAAAMAAASPAPEVTSLAAARHVRDEAEKKKRSLSGGWVVAVAAAVAFLIAIPIAIGFGGVGESVSDTASETTDSASFGTDDAGEAADAAGDATAESATSAEATADESMDAAEEAMEEPEEAMEEAMEEPEEDVAADGDEEAIPATTSGSNPNAELTDELVNRRNLSPANNVDVLNDLIDIGTITPRYTADQVLIADVSPDCLETDSALISDTPYGLALLTPFGGEDRLILVEFGEDGTTRLLDAEDCAVLR